MTREQFEAKLQGFFKHSNKDRSEPMWFLALEQWAKNSFNVAYEKEKAERIKQSTGVMVPVDSVS
jgi:hypothetical protein